MEKFYSKEEQILLDGIQLLETKKKMVQLAMLDQRLLELEERMDMMDGLKMEVYLL